jgi:hypothetical protein
MVLGVIWWRLGDGHSRLLDAGAKFAHLLRMLLYERIGIQAPKDSAQQ